MHIPKVGDLFTVPDTEGFMWEWRGQMGVVKVVTPNATGYDLLVTRLSDGKSATTNIHTAERLLWAHQEGAEHVGS